MDYIHIKNLEKYNPGYSDRTLIWCKIYFTMLNTNYEFDELDDIDKWRFIALVMLELQRKKPIPNDIKWLRKKISNHKKPISLTLKMLHNFIEYVTEDGKLIVGKPDDINKNPVTQNRIEESILDKNKEDSARPKADPRVSEVFKYWDEKYKAVTGEKYLFAGTKEGSLIKRILNTYDKNKTLDFIDFFFKEAEDNPSCWWVDKLAIGTFSACIPKIIRQITGGIKDGKK